MSSLYSSRDCNNNAFELKHRSLNVGLVLFKYKISTPTPIPKENEQKDQNCTCKVPPESPVKQLFPSKGPQRPSSSNNINRINRKFIPLKASTPVGKSSKIESSPNSNTFAT